ncbi:hypothetical protein QTJ16_000252 [Diplocarpon rosae]|uniref:Uncharacterized protein n=1 Tax=Diplocarpon rosae TaxID=946125 RepID=A0AAD9WF67_9HELO|nr:hypothetical protein QTJ16_000252 [Diplocarpon rosae]
MPLLFSPKPDQKIRRKLSTMAPQAPVQKQANVLPYRDLNNTSIKYAPGLDAQKTAANPYDSDAEPLVSQPSAEQASELSEYDRQHFTATGHPAPAFKASGLANLGGHMYTMPQLLPKRYTDDSIIPAIITDVIPSPKASDVRNAERKGLFSKLKGNKKDGEAKDKMLKVVYMPRREYQKFFARDEKGRYVGTEEHRRWTEDELEAEFAKYKPEPTQRRKEGVLSGPGQ